MGLAIGRHLGESVMINDDIEIMVTKASGGFAILHFNAPDHHKIWRTEIYEQMQLEKKHKKPVITVRGQ